MKPFDPAPVPAFGSAFASALDAELGSGFASEIVPELGSEFASELDVELGFVFGSSYCCASGPRPPVSRVVGVGLTPREPASPAHPKG